MTANLPAPKHSDISHQYGCPATLTVAFFVLHGIVHQATRFWRQDAPQTGRIEIYTIESYDPATTCTQLGWFTGTMPDFLDYVDEQRLTRADIAAMVAIAGAQGSTTAVPMFELDGAIVRMTLLDMT